jgi:TRAP-type transport system small permease protein
MTKFQNALVAICRIGTGIGFLVLIFAVVTQVLGRTVFTSSPPWTEELTRYAMLWTVALAAGLSFRSGDLVNVDIISEALPGRLPWLLRLTSAIATVGLCAALVLPAWRYMSIGVRQTSPVLGISMNWIFASILVLLVLLLVFALLRILSMLAGASDGRPDVNPDKQA